MQPLQPPTAGRMNISPRSNMEPHSCEVAPDRPEDDNLLRRSFLLSAMMRAFTRILPLSGDVFVSPLVLSVQVRFPFLDIDSLCYLS